MAYQNAYVAGHKLQSVSGFAMASRATTKADRAAEVALTYARSAAMLIAAGRVVKLPSLWALGRSEAHPCVLQNPGE